MRQIFVETNDKLCDHIKIDICETAFQRLEKSAERNTIISLLGHRTPCICVEAYLTC